MRDGTSARAGRNYAWMGYNTPEIHLQLPASDNSAYAETTFAPARLLDKAGRSVPHEKVSVTGSSVVVEGQPGWKMLEPPFGSDLDAALRAFDASGKRLEEDSSQQMSETLDAGGERTTHAFKGKVAQARLDVVEEWAEMDLSYDLPPSPLLARDAAGTKPAGGDEGGPAVHPSAVRREPKGAPPAR